MNVLDYIILLALAYGLGKGIWNGLFKELASLLSLIFGIMLARIFAPQFSQILSKWFEWSPQVTLPIAFVLILIAVTLGLHFLALILKKLAKALQLSWLNRIVGGLFGLFKVLLICSIVLNLVDLINSKIKFIPQNTINESLMYKPIVEVLPTVVPFFKDNTWDTLIPKK